VIVAFSIIIAAVLLGLLLGTLPRAGRLPWERGKDVYVHGRRVELVPLEAFSVQVAWTDVLRREPVDPLLAHLPPAARRRVERVRDRNRDVNPWIPAFYATTILDGLLLRGLEGRPTGPDETR
jgi:hypothetical protein